MYICVCMYIMCMYVCICVTDTEELLTRLIEVMGDNEACLITARADRSLTVSLCFFISSFYQYSFYSSCPLLVAILSLFFSPKSCFKLKSVVLLHTIQSIHSFIHSFLLIQL